MAVSVKACGIRSAEDLRVVLEAGVDRVGFICGTTHFSEDVLDPDEVSRLVALVPDTVAAVLVTHRVDATGILALAAATGVGAIQLHGLVTDRVVAQVRARTALELVRAVHVDEGLDLARIPELAAGVDALLLDSRTADRLGGTGQVHDWSISARIRELASTTPVYLAGGLTPGNLAAAIEQVRPVGVDANSGLEDAQGDKDPARVRAFVAAARLTG